MVHGCSVNSKGGVQRRLRKDLADERLSKEVMIILLPSRKVCLCCYIKSRSLWPFVSRLSLILDQLGKFEGGGTCKA